MAETGALVTVVLPERDEGALSEALRDLTRRIHEAGLADGSEGGLFGGEWGYGANYENAEFMMHRYCWCERDDCLWCGGGGCQAIIPRDPHGEACYQTRKQAFEREHGELLGVFDGRECYHVAYGSRHSKKYEAFKRRLCAELGCSYPARSEVHCTCGSDAEWRRRYDACECDWHMGRGQFRFGPAAQTPNFFDKLTGLQVRWYKHIGRDMELVNPSGADPATIVRALRPQAAGSLAALEGRADG